MGQVNFYDRQLSRYEIERGDHRNFIGGMWDEVGELQFNFLKEMGLQPQHKFGDIGCGALRGGVRIIPYLDAGNYYGLDINASCIEAAWYEIEVHGLERKRAELLVDDGFRMRKFGAMFDYCIGVSLFTHLPMNHIIRCLIETAPCLAEGGQFFATFFLCEEAELLNPVHQPRGGVVTNFDSDPYHYTAPQIEWMAGLAGLTSARVEWGHPRSQRMIRFTKIKEGSNRREARKSQT